MSSKTIDILIITFNRPEYTRLSLEALLESCDQHMHVWAWHNGNDQATLDAVKMYRDHPAFDRFHHCPENEKVVGATNWLIRESEADLLAVIGDDCKVTDGWGQTLRQAHHDAAELGVLACWHYQPEDYDPALSERKMREFPGGHRVIVNPWVQGSGVMWKRACTDRVGTIGPKERGFTGLCFRIAFAGWTNGWYYPLIPIDHFDDPRSPHSALRSDAALQANRPLSAQAFGADSLEAWDEQLRRSARLVQSAPAELRHYTPWRRFVRRQVRKVAGVFGVETAAW